MILVTRVSAPLGKESNNFINSGESIPIALIGGSTWRKIVRFTSGDVSTYILASL